MSRGFSGFRTDSARRSDPLAEDQAVDIMGDVGRDGFGLGEGEADRADEETGAVLPMLRKRRGKKQRSALSGPLPAAGRKDAYFFTSITTPGITCMDATDSKS